MAASRKPPNADLRAALRALKNKSVAVGLSGGIDSVVLLHALHAAGAKVSAIHVHHGLSPNADGWTQFCLGFCRALEVPLEIFRVKVKKARFGLEAAAREARRAAFLKSKATTIALAHNQDDQAETVLFNLLRGTGLAGAKGMTREGRLGSKRLLRPLLDVPRETIAAYAAAHRLGWIEDESNRDEALTRNFLRHRVGPLLKQKFPRWQASLARAARHFAAAGVNEEKLLRAWLSGQGLRAPGEARLGEMIKQLQGRGAEVRHDGKLLRTYRGKAFVTPPEAPADFKPRRWNGERRLALPELGGELRARKVRGKGIDAQLLDGKSLEVRLRAGGERLQPDPKRPHRSLKNLFQESGVPPWQRERLPLLFCGENLVWVPGLGIDAKFANRQGAGIELEWRPLAD
jgi:tRNA(Ile)-lysidine synthase